MDLDAIAALAEAEGVDAGPHADLRLRSQAEAVAASGLRWGMTLELAARTRDGRRGLQPRDAARAVQPGLVTGLGGPGLEADAAAGLTAAEVFLKAPLFEIHAGHGPTAAQRERLTADAALRLTSADGALIDPIGAGLVDTGLSLTAPAPQITVRTRRLAGLSLSASYTPDGDVCGVERCLSAAHGEVEDIVSAAVTFDRRAPRSGVRWRLLAAAEAGQAVAGPLSGTLDDPWAMALQLARESGATRLSINATAVRDGAPGLDYSAWSATVSTEAGDWLMEAQLGRADGDAADRTGWTGQIGASRYAGRNGLVGGAVQLQSDGGAALIAEAGLRF